MISPRASFAAILLVLTVITLQTLQSTALAESIFLKDGSILEGKLQGENESAYTVALPNGIKAEIPRSSVLRVVRGEEYKRQVYIYKKDGTELRAHIVFEDNDAYTVRKQIHNADEILVRKSDVREISAQRMSRYSSTDAAKRIYPERDAVLYSLIPITSGSSLPGYTVPGAILCVLKTAGFASVLASVVYMGIGSTNDAAGSAGAYVFSGASAALWISATLTDVFYSLNRIRAHNRALQGTGLRAGETGIAFSPRISLKEGINACPRMRCDGLNVHVYTLF